MKIKNFKNLAINNEVDYVLKILESGLCAALSQQALKKIIKENKIIIGKQAISLARYQRIFVIAFGKSADLMAKTISSHIRVAGGIVVIPNNTKSILHNKKFEIVKAGHPIPNAKSIAAAKKILKFLRQRKATDFVIFAVSGGGSSLVCLPAGISLLDKKIITNLLLNSGASIQEINCVRKHLSKIKGGQMVDRIPCYAISLVVSDVVGDDISAIASGTTYFDKTTFEMADVILRKYKLKNSVPSAILKRIELGKKGKIPETPKSSRIKNYIIATNYNCLKAMEKTARSIGITPKIVYPISENVQTVSAKLLKMLPKKPSSCIIFGGEPTVKVNQNGKGGRNQELVLRILAKSQKTRQNLVIASVGTDGIDGNTCAAGAVTESAIKFKQTQYYLQKNDSYHFFKKYGGLIFTGPTHTNLMDIGVILRR